MNSVNSVARFSIQVITPENAMARVDANRLVFLAGSKPLSIGLEDPADIIADLEQALGAA